MVDVVWSAKRQAMIPGDYEGAYFVPFNGDEPIPKSEVIIERPKFQVIDQSTGQPRPASSKEYFKQVERNAQKGTLLVIGVLFSIFMVFWIIGTVNQSGHRVVSQPNPVVASSESPISQSVPGMSPTGQTAKANTYGRLDLTEGMAQIGNLKVENIAISKTRVACASDPGLVDSLKRELLKAIHISHYDDFGVMAVDLPDGKAKLVGLQYSFEPGDPGVVTQTADYFLINEQCQALLLIGS